MNAEIRRILNNANTELETLGIYHTFGYITTAMLNAYRVQILHEIRQRVRALLQLRYTNEQSNDY